MSSLTRPLYALLLAGALSLGLFASGCNEWPEWAEQIGKPKPGSGDPGTSGGASGCGGAAPSPTTCDYHGKPIPEGSSVPSDDGCNTCVCKGGDFACTERACPPPPANQCMYQGKLFPEGASLNIECNECICKGGTFSCTKKGCPPPPPPPPTQCTWKDGKVYAEGDALTLDSCTTCYCKAGSFSCANACTPPVLECTTKDGKVYPDGSKVVIDECNSCYCKAGVIGGCTSNACPPATGCVHNNQVFAEGTTVEFPPECLDCVCNKGGKLSCKTTPSCTPTKK